MRERTHSAMVFTSLLFTIVFAAASVSWAGQIQLNLPWTPVSALNRAPPFYVWQNDPGLTEYLFPNGTTGLCVPAAISNSMIYQYAFKSTRATHLKLPGLSADGNSINSNTLVRYYAKQCNYNDGVDFLDAGKCILNTYLEAGYVKPKVTVIRKYMTNDEPRMSVENRAPTLSDLRRGLDEGYEVIASLAMMKFDYVEKKWVKQSGHAIGVYGMNGNEIYVSNPTRAYRMNFVDPLFDVATLKLSDPQMIIPPMYAPIEVTGRLLNFPNQTTFLAGLIFMKPE